MGTQAFQEAPSTELTSVFTKWSYCVKNTEELDCVIDKAFHIAQVVKKVLFILIYLSILANKIPEESLKLNNEFNTNIIKFKN